MSQPPEILSQPTAPKTVYETTPTLGWSKAYREYWERAKQRHAKDREKWARDLEDCIWGSDVADRYGVTYWFPPELPPPSKIYHVPEKWHFGVAESTSPSHRDVYVDGRHISSTTPKEKPLMKFKLKTRHTATFDGKSLRNAGIVIKRLKSNQFGRKWMLGRIVHQDVLYGTRCNEGDVVLVDKAEADRIKIGGKRRYLVAYCSIVAVLNVK